MVDIQFLEVAQDELDDFFESYEYRQKNMGFTFVKEVQNTLYLIKTYSDVWEKSSSHTSRCMIKGFPCAVIYQKVDETIWVVAIKNLHKKPTHWASKSVSEYSPSRISSLPDTIYTR